MYCKLQSLVKFLFLQDKDMTFPREFLCNFLFRNLGLAPVLKKYVGYQIYQYKYNRRTSTLVSIYVTQDKYNRRTSTLIMLCKHVIVRDQQENKGSVINSKHKQLTMTAIKHCMQRQGTSSTIPIVRVLRQQRFWLLNLCFAMRFYLEIVYSATK
jgi:hypothetical protein